MLDEHSRCKMIIAAKFHNRSAEKNVAISGLSGRIDTRARLNTDRDNGNESPVAKETVLSLDLDLTKRVLNCELSMTTCDLSMTP
ncbi:hypothetical protein EVAR_4552_1 [Eumeta japonica]|uniref:Uncharacterized protein n=1 Tax=Eumeta variegata TaxID=151549 RepID=A0A4C1SW48_EUMVA|nr:hypothetical protein EVAR_4552_1 [Eumeta japonica]